MKELNVKIFGGPTIGIVLITFIILSLITNHKHQVRYQKRWILVYNSIKGPLADFHAGIREIKTRGNRKVLKDQLNQLKKLAQQQRAILSQSKSKYNKLTDIEVTDFKLAVDSAEKYLDAFADPMTMSARKDTLFALADSLIENMRRLEKHYDLPHAGAPELSDLDQAIRHVCELVRNYLGESQDCD